MKKAFLTIYTLIPSLLWSASWTGQFKLDNLGYRPADEKFAMATADPGTVTIRDLSDLTQYTVPAGNVTAQGADTTGHHGDTIWWIDFSAFATPGTYRLYSSNFSMQSYDFDIAADVFNASTIASIKSFYYQRCGVAHPASFAGNWTDAGVCHSGDTSVSAEPGNANLGTLDLSGGWHDAGDYNKYMWYAVADPIVSMLTAYEDNPAKMIDAQFNIPESGNGLPDLLDEIKFELDWVLKMQKADGSFIGQVYGGFGAASPPSTDGSTRTYWNDPNGSANQPPWVGTGSLAIAARIFAAESGQAAYAATLKAAALNGWTYLNTQPNSDGKVWAAAEIYRLDQSISSAKTYVDGYNWPTSGWAYNNWDQDGMEWWAGLAYAQAPGATASTVTKIKNLFSARINTLFTNDDSYRAGMSNMHYYWGSNRPRAFYGLMLQAGAKLGATGSYTAQQALNKSEDFLHWFNGRNTKNMLYVSNLNSIGGENSSYMFYHAWFGSYTDTQSFNNYIGKPPAFAEPNYPYYSGTDSNGKTDNNSSTYGPAPGFVPGGPNNSYSGNATPPSGETLYDRTYRDWNHFTGTGNIKTWEITENSISSQGPYAALGIYHMGFAVPTTPTFTRTPTPNWTATPTLSSTPAPCFIPLNMMETINENGAWSGVNALQSIAGAGAWLTQGSGALQVSITTTAVAWQDNWAVLTGLTPTDWSLVTSIGVDFYIDPADSPYTAWIELILNAADSTVPLWYEDISVAVPVATGMNSLIIPLDWSAGGLTAANTITSLRFILNMDGVPGTGTVYLDNLRLYQGCAAVTASPSATVTSDQSFTFTSSATPSATPSYTETVTLTPSVNVTFTSTPSFSFTPTPVPSSTASPTPTPFIVASCKRLGAYYTYWNASWYNEANIPWGKLTHLFHAFIGPNADGSLSVPGSYRRPALNAAAQSNGVKIMVSVGGASATFDANYRTIVASTALRATFISNIENFLRTNNYDGIDFDWEFPRNGTDRSNFNTLVQEMRAYFDSQPAPAPSWMMSSVLPAGNWYGQWMDANTLKNSLDFFNLMAYDMHGDWSPHSGHNSQLNQPTADWNAGGDQGVSIVDSAAYWQGRGLPDSQVNLGMAFYGREFSTENLYDPCSNCEVGGGGVIYKDVVGSYFGAGWTEYWDSEAQSPYMLKDSGVGVLTYDNPRSIREKTDYAFNTRNYGGVFMWALEQDYLGFGNQPLLDEMYWLAFCFPASPTPTFTATPIIFLQSPTPTPTFTPTATATPTVTSTATPQTRELVHNGDNVAWTLAAGSYNGSNYTSGGSQGINSGARFEGSAASVDYDYIEFWVKASGDPAATKVSVDVGGSSLGTLSAYLPSFEDMGYGSGQWVQLSVALEEFVTQAGEAFTLSDMTIMVEGGGSVDDVYLVRGAVPELPSGDGPNTVKNAVAAPNPISDNSQAAIFVEMAGPVQSIEVEIYTTGMLRLGQAELIGVRKGWNKVPLDPVMVESMSNGLYYARIVGIRDGKRGKSAIAKIFILR